MKPRPRRIVPRAPSGRPSSFASRFRETWRTAFSRPAAGGAPPPVPFHSATRVRDRPGAAVERPHAHDSLNRGACS
jgi:hypothetical protein